MAEVSHASSVSEAPGSSSRAVQRQTTQHLDERITAIRCDHRAGLPGGSAFKRIVLEGKTIDILINNVWGGYERMVEDGNFTWPKPFWDQPLWRWDAMFGAGVRAYYQASQLAARSMIAERRGLIVNISSGRRRNISEMSPMACRKLRLTR